MKKTALILLAAGASRRFGEADKLTAPWRGQPLITHAVATFQDQPFAKRIATVRDNANKSARLCREHGFETLENPAADDGIGASIAAGVSHCRDMDGVMIALADMPLIKSTTIDAVLAVWNKADAPSIIAPIHDNRRGHPVIFANAFFDALAALGEDQGAAAIIKAHGDALISAPVDDPGIHTDFDTAIDFAEK